MVASGAKLGLVLALVSVFVVYKLQFLFVVPPIPKYEEVWWGPGEARQVDGSIRPFKINISNEDLQDLKVRLEDTLPFQKPLEGVKQHYGMNTDLLQTVVDFWKTKYDWREREKFFNQYPQYLVNIQGLDIHYVHVKPKIPKGTKVFPIIALHGWVGSFREFYELIPFLTTPQKGRDFVFELIIPSLPGFGFTDAAAKPGLSAFHMAVILKNLMLKVGHPNFYIHGTDWGASVAQHLAILFPQHVIALHSSFCTINTPLSVIKMFLFNLYPSLFVEKELEDVMFPLSKIWSFRILEGGYFHIQSTKPDTIGVGLRESPAGLAAYLLEKFVTITNPSYKDLDDGGLTNKYTLTQLLDDIMVYWVSRSITSSMRIYSEVFYKDNENYTVERNPVTVPTACARFKYDVVFYPGSVLKERYPNLMQLTYYEAGHFPAMEVPEILSEDIFDFVQKVQTNKDKHIP